MWDRPVAGRAVAEEASGKAVVHAAVSHAVERLLGDLTQFDFFRRRIGFQHQPQGVGVGELRFPAKAAELRVEIATDGDQHHFRRRCVEGRRAQIFRGRPLCRYLRGLLGNLVFTILIDFSDMVQQANHAGGRDIGFAVQRSSLRGQERGSRPASHVITGVDIRAAVVIHFDWNEVVLNPLLHFRGGVRSRVYRIAGNAVVHDMTPMTPDGADVQKNRLVLRLRLSKGFVAPFTPKDRIVAAHS